MAKGNEDEAKPCHTDLNGRPVPPRSKISVHHGLALTPVLVYMSETRLMRSVPWR